MNDYERLLCLKLNVQALLRSGDCETQKEVADFHGISQSEVSKLNRDDLPYRSSWTQMAERIGRSGCCGIGPPLTNPDGSCVYCHG